MARPVRALNYYGSKVQSARTYPAPRHDIIFEPFAGGAGYSLAHREKTVVLCDADADVIDVWRYLIGAPAAEIMALPLLEPGEPVPPLPRGPALLLGWSVMLCGARPQARLVPAAARVPSSFWGASRRSAIAKLVDTIRHWTAVRCSYSELPPEPDATWFIDPPYAGAAGSHYAYGSDVIDYAHLGEWCRTRGGQTIVCEGSGADWLPFRPFASHAAAPTADVRGRRVSHEMIWESP